jgi:hypothetical protein
MSGEDGEEEDYGALIYYTVESQLRKTEAAAIDEKRKELAAT